MRTGICAYITNHASEEVNDVWVIRNLVQMVVLGNSEWSDYKDSFHLAGGSANKFLLWIASDLQ